jgi:hypothetical protein
MQLWHNGSKRQKELADFTMILAIAIGKGTLRRTSQEHETKYTQNMSEYMRRQLELFPNKPLKPNDHAALHLGEFF